jgi:hypothetical protein
MKLISATIFKKSENSVPSKIWEKIDTSNFSIFSRSKAVEYIQFSTRLVATKTERNVKSVISCDEIPYVISTVLEYDGLIAAVITDEKYPEYPRFRLLHELLRVFRENMKHEDIKEEELIEIKPLSDLFTSYQTPEKVDKILKIQKEIDTLKDIMHINIEQILENGQSIDDLIIKSDKLSGEAVKFYKQAKKINKCCWLF